MSGLFSARTVLSSNTEALARTRSRRLIMSGYRNPWRAQECLGHAMLSTGLYRFSASGSRDTSIDQKLYLMHATVIHQHITTMPYSGTARCPAIDAVQLHHGSESQHFRGPCRSAAKLWDRLRTWPLDDRSEPPSGAAASEALSASRSRDGPYRPWLPARCTRQNGKYSPPTLRWRGLQGCRRPSAASCRHHRKRSLECPVHR